MLLQRIISGAQTGVDRGALDAAMDSMFPCGGWCPSGRLAEDGSIPSIYPVTELDVGSYRARTIKNVLESNGTLIIYFAYLRGGTEQTVLNCIKKAKPYKLIDAAEISTERASKLVLDFITLNAINTLNVAGPSLSNSNILYIKYQ
jgi:hypothetical protein